MKTQIKDNIRFLLNLLFRGNNFLSLYLKGHENRAILRSFGKSNSFYSCRFVISGGGVEIGSRGSFRCLYIYSGMGCTVRIGNKVTVNAYKQSPAIINAYERANINIGDECLFSNGVELHTSDYHSLMQNGVRYNRSSDIEVGKHTWLGLRTVVLKGIIIAPDTVVAACSVVTNSIYESNMLIAGSPAKVVKENIEWNINRL